MFRQRKRFLGVTRRVGEIDLPVTAVELEYAVYSGAKLKVLAEGMVPVFEEHLARMERGISLEAWGTMPLYEKAMIIALRRIHNALQNLQNEAEIRDAERKAKRRNKR